MADLALHLDAVAGFVQQIQGTAAFGDVMAKQKVHFEQCLQNSSLSVGDAEKVCAALKRIPWSAEALSELLGIVALKTLESGPSESGRCKLQDFTNLKHYLSPEMWRILTNDSCASHTKLEILIGHATALGLRNASGHRTGHRWLVYGHNDWPLRVDERVAFGQIFDQSTCEEVLEEAIEGSGGIMGFSLGSVAIHSQ